MIVGDHYLDLREIGKRLSTSGRTIRAWIHDPVHPLPAYRVGGKLLFRWSEVQAWVRQHRVQPVDADGLVNEMLANIEDDK